jgi:hypothetical protein
MKKLSINSTKIFCRLLSRLGDQAHLQIRVENYMPLTIERIGSDIATPYGKADWYSVSHSYEQNGDLMRDPEMCFLGIDQRTEHSAFDQIAIYPQMYQQDNMGVYEESIHLDAQGVKNYIPVWQHAHVGFANVWLTNIKAQGFLK